VYNKYIKPGNGEPHSTNSIHFACHRYHIDPAGERGVRLTDGYLSFLEGVTEDQIPALYKSLRTKGSEEHARLEKYKRDLKMSEASAARWSNAISKSVLDDVRSRDSAYQKRYLKAVRKALRKAEKAAKSSKDPTALSTTAGSKTFKASSKATPRASSVSGPSIDSLSSGTSTLVTAAA
jgi:hypothetical protein